MRVGEKWRTSGISQPEWLENECGYHELRIGLFRVKRHDVEFSELKVSYFSTRRSEICMPSPEFVHGLEIGRPRRFSTLCTEAWYLFPFHNSRIEFPWGMASTLKH